MAQLVLTQPWLQVYADWCAPCKQIAPYFDGLARSLSRPNQITFVKINNDEQTELATEYGVTALPTFLLFRNGKVNQKVQGANPLELKKVVEKLVSEIESLGSESGSGSGSGGPWKGAEVPRGYSDITDQIEIRNCELLNADDDAGPVKVLFEDTKPSALGDGKGKASSPDWIQSSTDDQLLLFIPFQSSIKLHTLQVCTKLATHTSLTSAALTGGVLICRSRPSPPKAMMRQPDRASSTYTSTGRRTWTLPRPTGATRHKLSKSAPTTGAPTEQPTSACDT